MTLLPGAHDLGLEVDWQYAFVGEGERAVSTPGVVYVDVGGARGPGVIDHHAGDGLPCASDVVTQCPELVYHHLLGPRLARIASGAPVAAGVWRPTLVTHRSPDWDGVVAVHLIQRLIADGALPGYAGALACYARLVDQGRYRLDPGRPETLAAPHVGYLALQHRGGADDRATILRGLSLLETVLHDVLAAGRQITDEHAFQPSGVGAPAARWWQDPQFADARATLERQRELFDEDRAHRDLTIPHVYVPAADGGEPLLVPAWVARAEPKSALDKYFVRHEGYGLFLCPRGLQPRADGQPHFAKVIISLDPHWKHAPSERRPSLWGLGLALERAEAEERRALYSGSDDRAGPPRFADGSTDNSDPWYDGRGQNWTIVDAPRGGTRLPLAKVVEVVTEHAYWETPLVEGTLSFVWPLATSSAADDAAGVQRPADFADTLDPLYSELSDAAANVPGSPEVRRRSFPKGTAHDFEVVTFTGAPGTTLEGLVRGAAREVNRRARKPSYRFGRIDLAPHAADRNAAVLGALAKLGFEHTSVVAYEDRSAHLDRRSLLLVGIRLPNPGGRDGASGEARAPGADGRGAAAARTSDGEDSDREVLLYAAFVNETLSRFSQRIADVIPRHDEPIESVGAKTPGLRRDVLRFQARHYQLEVGRTAAVQQLFTALSDAFRVEAHYQEVLVELDRLSDLERQLAAARTSRAERALASVLYVLAAAGVFQTVIAFAMLPAEVRAPQGWWVGFWTATAFIAIALVVAYRQIERIRTAGEMRRTRL